MPSREEMYFLPEKANDHHLHHHHHHHHTAPTTTQDFKSRDIEDLVSEIKENLRLSSFKSRHQRRTVRPSPYSNPSRSLSDSYCESCAKNASSCPDEYSDHNSSATSNRTTTTTTNFTCPHRSTRATATINFIRAKSNGPDDPYEMLQDLLREGDLIKEAVRRLQKVSSLSPKQRYFYDSDDESSRSPRHLCKKVEV